MKRKPMIQWLLLLLIGVLVSCGGRSDSPEAQAERLAESGKKICEKMFECMDEQLKGLPADQQEMARKMMGGKEACYKQYNVDKPDAADHGSVDDTEFAKITQEELNLAVQCMEEITKTSCQDLVSDAQPASCKKLQQLSKNRH